MGIAPTVARRTKAYNQPPRRCGASGCLNRRTAHCVCIARFASFLRFASSATDGAQLRNPSTGGEWRRCDVGIAPYAPHPSLARPPARSIVAPPRKQSSVSLRSPAPFKRSLCLHRSFRNLSPLRFFRRWRREATEPSPLKQGRLLVGWFYATENHFLDPT